MQLYTDCRDKKQEEHGKEREMEGFIKVFAKCFPDLPLTVAGPRARVQMDNYMPYVKYLKFID